MTKKGQTWIKITDGTVKYRNPILHMFQLNRICLCSMYDGENIIIYISIYITDLLLTYILCDLSHFTISTDDSYPHKISIVSSHMPVPFLNFIYYFIHISFMDLMFLNIEAHSV